MVMTPSMVHQQSPSVQETASELLKRRELTQAIQQLQQALPGSECDETYGLLGTAYLLAERYEEAIACLERAVQLDGVTNEWSDKLELARRNLRTGASMHFHSTAPLETREILAPPTVTDDALPLPPVWPAR